MHLHLHARPRRGVPGGRREADGPQRRAAPMRARDRRAGRAPARDPRARALLRRRLRRRRATSTCARRSRSARTSRARNDRDRVQQQGRARSRSTRPPRPTDTTASSTMLASNETPWGPHEAVREAVDGAARAPQPLPGPDRRALAAAARGALRPAARADRGRQRVVRDPAGRRRGDARARRRDRLRVAVVLDVSAPGGDDRRARDHRAAGRRRPPRPRGDGARGDARHPDRARVQPEQPDWRPRSPSRRSTRS